MLNLGIITEYNPLHYGHILHLKKSKEISKREHTICVMSGDFVQRGETSFLSKHIRTKMALASGVDLVIMLPVVYSCQSSERFAFGSIKTLEKSGIVDSFSFGSESGNIDILKKYANFLNNPPRAYNENLKKHLNLGYSFPKAREESINQILGKNILNSPNNNLGVDYLRFNKKLTPYTIKRMGEDYHSSKIDNIPSATGIREYIYSNNEIPENSVPDNIKKIIYENKMYISNYDKLSEIFHFILFTKTKEELLKIVDINEELLNRLTEESKKNLLISHIANHAKCKNYTYTRIKRVINNIILNITNIESEIKYIRVLGFNKKKDFLISKLMENSTVPVIMNTKEYKNKLDITGINMFEKDLLAWNMFNLTINYKYKSDLEMPIIKF